MHFIQNSWFAYNWIFLLLFLIGSFTVVAYINNKRKMFKYTSILFILFFLFVLMFLILPEINNSLSLRNNIGALKLRRSDEENISTFSKIIDFVFRILKDKLRD